MRISDWSSDVCSSDLFAPDSGGIRPGKPRCPESISRPARTQAWIPGRKAHTPETLRVPGSPNARNDGLLALRAIGWLTDAGWRRPQRLISPDDSGTPAPRDQIGRAACRERVCQYV